MTADVALHLDAGDAEVTRRLLARAALEHRSDDTAEVIAQRLALDHQVTAPILCWYRNRQILVSVDAMRPCSRSAVRSSPPWTRSARSWTTRPGGPGTSLTWPPWGRRSARPVPQSALPLNRPCTADRQ
jgi:hypothetical protein